MVVAVVATMVEAPTKIVMRTVALDLAVPYGSLMKLNDNNTVTITSGDADPWGGICTFEKLATDTDILKIPCAMDGVWEISTDAGAITAGAIVSVDALNQIHVTNGTNDQIAGSNIGQAESTKDGAERINVRLRG